jgi:hypothetical protein
MLVRVNGVSKKEKEGVKHSLFGLEENLDKFRVRFS